MRQRRAPAITAREDGVAGGGADRGGRIRIGKAATFCGEAVDGGGTDQFGISTKAAGAAVAVVIGEDDDDIRLFRSEGGTGE